jgi:tetratricopeptide (TPR) repeat protein
MRFLPMNLTGNIALLLVALVAVSLSGCPVARAAGQKTVRPSSTVGSQQCPPPNDLRAALGNASALMAQARYQDAAETLKPLASLDCDPRASLLLAAAFEAAGDVPEAEQTLQRAHSVWPANNSIAASLAREYMSTSDVQKAVTALVHFHATPATPQQEMEEAVVVYIAARRLVSAQAVAETAYKTYPSVHSVLMLANTLQLEGRYPDVNRLLGDKRSLYADSPEFFITLAESEFDAGIYPPAREDLEHSIALNANLYQAHYVLANTLVKLNDVERAIDEYNRAITLAPNQPRTYFQLAMVMRSKQDEAAEQRILGQALSADDHYAPAHCEMGRILLEAHHPEEAVSHLNSAIQYNPRSEQAYFLLAKAYAGLGEKDKSKEMVKRLMAVREANRPSSHDNGNRSAANPDDAP